MMKNHLFYFTLCTVLIASCGGPQETTSETQEETAHAEVITVDLSDAIDFTGSLSAADGSIQTNGDGGTASFEIGVKTTGRYQAQVHVASSDGIADTIWLEDHADNTDGRTYNVTGNMYAAGNSDGMLFRDGSPLSAGTHKMRVHVSSGDAAIKGISFELIKAQVPTPEHMKQHTDGERWVLAWSDEFDGAGLIDESKWTYDVGDWGWGNNELQYYTVRRLENCRQEGGNLVIEARKNDDGNLWTSARITTREKVSFTYGKIEFRAKVPTRKGNWAAGWTLGDDYVDEKSWPYCGEIDILESVGYEMDDESGDGKAHASIHCGAYYFKLGNQPTSTVDVQNMHEEFHTYAVEWLPTGIKAYVDDQEYFEYSDTSSDLSWPFDRPQNLILNLAMGGGWGGAQGMDESVTLQKFVIDYVRVYELQ